MSEQKSYRYQPPLYHRQAGDDADEQTGRGAERTKEQQGWEAYRRWLGQTSRKAVTQRAPRDHSIYSWKGYQNWADKVRQSWNPDDS